MSGVFAVVPGQPSAVRQLQAAAARPVHAYALIGPAGVGVREAARGFTAALVCDDGGCGACRACSRALAEAHPDVLWVERVGASISKAQIDDVLRVAARAPAEGKRNVIVLVDFHLVAQQYPRLLKTLEEPPARTVFVLLADDLGPELVTVASRCVRVDFGPLPESVIEAVLIEDGVAVGESADIAAAAGGRLDRARLLVHDPGFRQRRSAWLAVPAHLDGRGAPIVELSEELRAGIDGVLEPLATRQDEERAALDARLDLTGERGGWRKELEERHRREQRRVRTDELRFGLATLAGVYRDRLREATVASDRRRAVAAVAAINAAGEALVRNPNEALLLHGLFARLSTE